MIGRPGAAASRRAWTRTHGSPHTGSQRPDGKRIWFTPYPTPLRDAEGRVAGGINMLVDITERKQVEEVQARLAAIVDSSDDAIVGKTLERSITKPMK